MRGRGWRRLLRLGRSDLDDDVRDEIAAHIDMHIDELIATGVPADEARRAALRRFGDPRRYERAVIAEHDKKENAMRRIEFVTELVHDIRFAGRQLRRRPVFAAMAVAVIALGIGVGSSVFAVVDAALLRPLPFADADRLVYVTD